MANEIKETNKDTYNNTECVQVPPVDIYESENEYVLKAELPGVKKESLNITIEDNELEIRGTVEAAERDENELKYREFTLETYERKFKIGNDIDTESISANLEDGILTLKLAKREEVKPKKIKINV